MVEVKGGGGGRSFPQSSLGGSPGPIPHICNGFWSFLFWELVDFGTHPHVNTVSCKTANLKKWEVPQINGLKQAGTLPCTLVPVSEIETAVWPAIDISKLPASICSKRQICWDSCDLCFRFISKNIAKIVNGTFSEVAIWMILILVLKWQYQNQLNNSKVHPQMR